MAITIGDHRARSTRHVWSGAFPAGAKFAQRLGAKGLPCPWWVRGGFWVARDARLERPGHGVVVEVVEGAEFSCVEGQAVAIPITA